MERPRINNKELTKMGTILLGLILIAASLDMSNSIPQNLAVLSNPEYASSTALCLTGVIVTLAGLNSKFN